MIAMPQPQIDKDWITTVEAAALAGCTEGYIRRLLRDGDRRLRSWRAGERAWLVSRADVLALRETLSSRATVNREQRPASPKPKKKRKPW